MITVSTMNKKQKLNALAKLLEKHGFYFQADLVLTEEGLDEIGELTKKAYGDSYERETSEVFGSDYKDLMKLAKSLKIKLPESVWFD